MSRMRRSIVCHGARFVLFVWFNNIRHLLIGIITIHIGWKGLSVHIPGYIAGHILVRSMRRLIRPRGYVEVSVMITILLISPLIIRLRSVHSVYSIYSIPAIHPADGSTNSTVHIGYVL